MFGLVSIFGIITYFISFYTIFLKLFFNCILHLIASLLIEFAHLTFLQHPVEWRTLFVGQAVSRHMLHIELNSLFYIRHPLSHRLLR